MSKNPNRKTYRKLEDEGFSKYDWKTIEDKTTFTKDSLLIFELISNGKIIDKEVANYSLKNNTITVKFKNQNPYDFKVLKLNNSEMELLNIKEKRAFRYVK
ncbi:lipocalin family protein [Flavobacterium fluviatile]|uniref:lipocalin family protein n=1 Tax=Flavobacterium fluviatile TaxID=1862387 RepID=UPI0013D46085|nr:lipocalin family protein [Flavobacterium fluviatile]